MLRITPARRTLLERVLRRGPVFLKPRERMQARKLEEHGYISILEGLDMRFRPCRTASITSAGRELCAELFEPRENWEQMARARGLIKKGEKNGKK